MLQPLGDEAVHVPIVQGIEHILAVFAGLYQFCRPQQPQLVRCGG